MGTIVGQRVGGIRRLFGLMSDCHDHVGGIGPSNVRFAECRAMAMIHSRYFMLPFSSAARVSIFRICSGPVWLHLLVHLCFHHFLVPRRSPSLRVPVSFLHLVHICPSPCFFSQSPCSFSFFTSPDSSSFAPSPVSSSLSLSPCTCSFSLSPCAPSFSPSRYSFPFALFPCPSFPQSVY